MNDYDYSVSIIDQETFVEQLPTNVIHSKTKGQLERLYGEHIKGMLSVHQVVDNRQNIAAQKSRLRTHLENKHPIKVELGLQSNDTIKKIHSDVIL